MRGFKISPLLLLVSITCMLMGSATAQEVPKEVFERGVFFSTEEDFVTRGPLPPGGPIISDGDLLNSAGYVYMRNSELLSVFNVDFDLGLDADDVINVEDRFVIFSTELDHPRGMFTAGDLLATNGAIVPNAALLAAFDIPRGLDLGLDAVHFKGELEDSLKGLAVDKPRFSRAIREESPGQKTPLILRIKAGDKTVGYYSPLDLTYSASGYGAYDLRGYDKATAVKMLVNMLLMTTRS